MIKLTFCLRRRPDLSREAFYDYWLNQHAPLVRRHQSALRMRRYIQLHGRELKYLLKKVAGRYLPNGLINREKQGFSFPIARWLRSDLKDYTQRLFRQSRFVEAGIFEPEYMSQLLDEHLEGDADHNYRLWILINLEIWYRMYFEGCSVDDMQDLTDELLCA